MKRSEVRFPIYTYIVLFLDGAQTYDNAVEATDALFDSCGHALTIETNDVMFASLNPEIAKYITLKSGESNTHQQ